ncbi:hypothetical protein [Nocardioides dilutus]
MRIRNILHSKVGAVVAGSAVVAMVAAGSAYAATQITSAQIKDGTIQTRDLTANNFARFTATENVVSATTPVNPAPGLGGARVVEVAASGETPLVTLVLDKGTWQIDGVAQFWHIDGPAPSGADFGVVTIPGLLDGFGKAYTADVPDGGGNAAQTAFGGTIQITANNTPVVITGSFTNDNTGEAGVSVRATQYVYVKQFKNGQPI